MQVVNDQETPLGEEKPWVPITVDVLPTWYQVLFLAWPLPVPVSLLVTQTAAVNAPGCWSTESRLEVANINFLTTS